MRIAYKSKTIFIILITAISIFSYGLEYSDQEHIERITKRDKVDEAVTRGLEYLVSKQDPATGCFAGELPNTFTALSCMALMAAGQFPGRARYGDNTHRGIMYLVKATKAHKGYMGKEGNANMYGHGICALALCEAYGMMQKEEDNYKIKHALERVLKVTLYAQVKKEGPHFGGWRYGPVPADADLSPTSWQVLSLRAAQNCGLDVPKQVITNALKYVRSTYNTGAKGFSYQPGSGPSSAMRSAGVVCMLVMGADEEKDKIMIKNSANWIFSLNPSAADQFYFYRSYYLATSANMMGKKYREFFLPELEKFLLTLQLPTGEFKKYSGAYGGVYSTAFSVISLCVRYQYLPIYQE